MRIRFEHFPRRTARERGATLILFALLSVVLFIIVALVVDLGFVRQNRQLDKSSSDFAAAAGIRAMDDGSGAIYPWHGICAARDYLVVNNPELATATNVAYTTGEGVTHASNPCNSTSLPPYTTPCDSSTVNKATWGVYEFDAGGDAFHVTISSGYRFEDEDVPFAEDSGAYAGDPAASASNGCDQLAVVVEQKEGAIFGGIVGASDYGTRIRSVSRLIEGTDGEVAAALILLEREACGVLYVRGDNAIVRAEGEGPNPGIIHSDSDANGSCGDKIFSVNGSTPPPRITTSPATAADPITGLFAPGEITAVELIGDPASSKVSDGLDHVCARRIAAECGSAVPVIGAAPVGRELVGRGGVDERYRVPIIGLRTEAADRFSWTTEVQANAAGFVRVGCNDPGPFTSAKIWVDCGGGPFQGRGKTFDAAGQEVVINGYVTYSGPTPRVLEFKKPAKVFIKGRSGSSAISINNSDRVYVNTGASTDTDGDGFVCDQRFADAPAARTKMVIGQGFLTTNGGEVRLCQTTLFMMDNGSGDCSIPTVDGVAPYNNGCRGSIGGQGTTFYDWTAPNVNAVAYPAPDELAQFEDLALWSETEDDWDIAGGGGLFLRGIFFTPNANPTKVTGGGTTDVTDAQFITRRLEVGGQADFVLKPDAVNSILIPALKGFTLVR